MLTFEKVLEIFEDYLAQDMELEVYKSRYGYVCVSFNGSPHKGVEIPMLIIGWGGMKDSRCSFL